MKRIIDHNTKLQGIGIEGQIIHQEDNETFTPQTAFFQETN